MSIISDILGPLFGDLGLPSFSTIIRDIELLVLGIVGIALSVKLLEWTL